MPASRSRIIFLYIVTLLALGSSVHSFVTEGVEVSGVISALLAAVLGWEASRQLRLRSKSAGGDGDL